MATILNKELPAGSYEVEFGDMVGNKQFVSGIYFYQLRADEIVQTKKMILMR